MPAEWFKSVIKSRSNFLLVKCPFYIFTFLIFANLKISLNTYTREYMCYYMKLTYKKCYDGNFINL